MLLFLCFPRGLEGIAAKWYAEHVNPIELRDFNKVVNMFVERFLFNTEALPHPEPLCATSNRSPMRRPEISSTSGGAFVTK